MTSLRCLFGPTTGRVHSASAPNTEVLISARAIDPWNAGDHNGWLTIDLGDTCLVEEVVVQNWQTTAWEWLFKRDAQSPWQVLVSRRSVVSFSLLSFPSLHIKAQFIKLVAVAGQPASLLSLRVLGYGPHDAIPESPMSTEANESLGAASYVPDDFDSDAGDLPPAAEPSEQAQHAAKTLITTAVQTLRAESKSIASEFQKKFDDLDAQKAALRAAAGQTHQRRKRVIAALKATAARRIHSNSKPLAAAVAGGFTFADVQTIRQVLEKHGTDEFLPEDFMAVELLADVPPAAVGFLAKVQQLHDEYLQSLASRIRTVTPAAVPAGASFDDIMVCLCRESR
eukprot:TRINITY_DN6419_c0_g1_i1.p1 TRINITY_DN6419_c0_g1~~TRINITY_DN6419_c0_g1_i1.p1  ORF type:complete len:340 (-),score=52.54 TRINITY_DN6419_c0_g1_i1:94-1113(-)